MKRNLTVLLLVLALALSLVSPAMAVESEDTSAPVTWGELTADSPDLTLPVTGEPDQAVTNQEAVAYLLRWAGMEESQLGTYPADYNAMADQRAPVYERHGPAHLPLHHRRGGRGL